MDEKKCGKCRESKPLAAFSRHHSRPDGLQDRCKACNAVDLAERRERDPEKLAAQGREKSARYRAAHPERRREGFARWRAENIEEQRSLARERSAKARAEMTEEQREARREYDRARYLVKREEIKARSLANHYAKKDENNARSREYYRTHGGVDRGPVMVWAGKSAAEKRASNQDARVRRLGRVPGPGSREHVIVLCSSDQVCVHCGKFMPGGAEHVDHLVPLCAGGEHTVGNLVSSCGPCNAGRRKPRRVG